MSRNSFIETAKKFIGTPYVWGGESLTEGGFDCSGFLYNVFKAEGFKVARDTAQGYYNKYKKYEVSKSSIKAGCLLFFGRSKSSISHVAIALSSSTMIESIGGKLNTKYNKGKGVTISAITRRKDLVAVVDLFKDEAVKITYYPMYVGTSVAIDEIFKAIGAPNGNVAKRKPVAVLNGYPKYSGTASENIGLRRLAKQGKLRRT